MWVKSTASIEKHLQMFQNILLYLLVLRVRVFSTDFQPQYHCEKQKLKFRKINLIYQQDYKYCVSCCHHLLCHVLPLMEKDKSELYLTSCPVSYVIS